MHKGGQSERYIFCLKKICSFKIKRLYIRLLKYNYILKCTRYVLCYTRFFYIYHFLTNLNDVFANIISRNYCKVSHKPTVNKFRHKSNVKTVYVIILRYSFISVVTDFPHNEAFKVYEYTVMIFYQFYKGKQLL